LRERDELEAALEQASEGLRLAHELGAEGAERWTEWQACNLLALARIRQAQGDLDGALTVVQEAQEMLAGGGASAVAVILAAVDAQLRLAQGDLAAALQWWQTVEAHTEPPRFGLTPQVFVYADEHLEIAPMQVLLAQGRASGDPAPVRRALALLDQLHARAQRADLAWLEAKALTLQALAYQSLGETAPALAALERALAVAQPAGYIRLFVDEGVPMADLLRRMQGHGAAAGYAATVRAAFERHTAAAGEHQAMVVAGSASPVPLGASPILAPLEALTAREHEVLRLLAVGHANPAIARALYVEVNTIKTHVKNVYSKLGVHGRVHAVRRARELGLL